MYQNTIEYLKFLDKSFSIQVSANEVRESVLLTPVLTRMKTTNKTSKILNGTTVSNLSHIVSNESLNIVESEYLLHILITAIIIIVVVVVYIISWVYTKNQTEEQVDPNQNEDNHHNFETNNRIINLENPNFSYYQNMPVNNVHLTLEPQHILYSNHMIPDVQNMHSYPNKTLMTQENRHYINNENISINPAHFDNNNTIIKHENNYYNNDEINAVENMDFKHSNLVTKHENFNDKNISVNHVRFDNNNTIIKFEKMLKDDSLSNDYILTSVYDQEISEDESFCKNELIKEINTSDSFEVDFAS